MNQYLLYGTIIIVVVVTIIFAIKESLHPYVPAGPLFTKAELNFYRYLTQVVQGRALVFGKVRIADVIQPKQSIKGSKRVTALNKIAQKHFDFVLVDPNTMSILAAIELNDKSHLEKERATRDKFVRDAMKSCQIPLIEIPAAKSYDLANLFKLLAPTLECLRTENTPLQHVVTQPQPTHTDNSLLPASQEPETDPFELVPMNTPDQVLAKYSNLNKNNPENTTPDDTKRSYFESTNCEN